MQFYTGKPYVTNNGGYVYKYRTYNPEMTRWTALDPSGFPDGPNNYLYVQNPINGYDDNGLTLGYTYIEFSLDYQLSDITWATTTDRSITAYFDPPNSMPITVTYAITSKDSSGNEVDGGATINIISNGYGGGGAPPGPPPDSVHNWTFVKYTVDYESLDYGFSTLTATGYILATANVQVTWTE
jgi:RHS repeat-associated protein